LQFKVTQSAYNIAEWEDLRTVRAWSKSSIFPRFEPAINKNATLFRWHLKIFCSEVQGFSLKIVGFLWLVFSVDLDNSVFVKLLDLWFSSDNWIIDIVKV